MRPSRLAGMSGIGVDRMGNRADAMKGRDFLRRENLDTDIAPHERAIAASRAAVAEDKNNSYLPFVGQMRLRDAAAAGFSIAAPLSAR